MMKWLIGALAVLGLSAIGVFGASDFTDFTTEDVFVPTQCDSVAKHGDHLLVEYSIAFANGTVTSSQQAPMQLYYTLLDKSEEYPVMGALKGMCRNATRKITWENPSKADFKPIFYSSQNPEDNGVSIELTLVHITEAEDYRIFDYIRTGNSSAALDMIEQHRGINAFDEWGQNALMMAVQLKKLDIVAALLNTRLPKVNVNTAKSSGFTALIYAVELSAPTILQALLRRGADPHAIVKQPGSYGNTALHYACLFERTKHAELLLEYGAQPEARNEHGQRPLDLVPRDAVRSTKLYFKRIFDEAIAKQAAAAVGSVSSPSDTRMGAGSEL